MTSSLLFGVALIFSALLIHQVPSTFPLSLALSLSFLCISLLLWKRFTAGSSAISMAKHGVHTLIEGLADAAMTFDAAGAIIHANTMAANLFAHAGPLPGHSLALLLPSLVSVDADGSLRIDNTDLPRDGFEVKENIELPVEGRWLRFELRLIPILFKAAKASIFVLILHELNGQNSSEARPLACDVVLQKLIELLPVGTWVTDENGVVLWDNPAGQAIWEGGSPFGKNTPESWWRITDDGRSRQKEPLALRDWFADTEPGIYEIACSNSAFKIISTATAAIVNGNRREGAIIVQQDVTAFHRLNERLRMADEVLERLLHSLAIGVFISDIQDNLMMTNAVLCDYLGYSETELLGMRVRHVVFADEQSRHGNDWFRMVKGELPSFQAEVRCRHKDGHPVWLLLHAAIIRHLDGRTLYIVGQAVDVSARKLAEESLDTREKVLNMALQIARAGYWEWLPHEEGLKLSTEAIDILGLGGKRVIDVDTFCNAIHAEERSILRKHLLDLQADPKGFSLNCRIADKAGGPVTFINCRAMPIAHAGDCRHFIGTIIDVTEFKMLEQELLDSRQNLRLLTARQEQLLEDERRRLSLELHDELGQLLTGIRMANSALQLVHGDDPFLLQQAQRITKLVDKSIGVVRQVATNLRPIALDMGLIASLSWLAKQHQIMSGTPCTLDIFGPPPPQNDLLNITIFRTVQEALTNIVRHAASDKVSIRLVVSVTEIAVAVQDNGVGFDPKAIPPGKTLGLIGQQERLRGIGGSITINSAPGRGTNVNITIPIKSHEHSLIDN
jgi:PAS domain S-box-containing protein